MFETPKQLPFEVHVKSYHRTGYVYSQHRSLTQACRKLARAIRTIKDLETAAIWCARDNHTYSLNRARELQAQGYFDGIK